MVPLGYASLAAPLGGPRPADTDQYGLKDRRTNLERRIIEEIHADHDGRERGMDRDSDYDVFLATTDGVCEVLDDPVRAELLGAEKAKIAPPGDPLHGGDQQRFGNALPL